jgi:UDP-N-acetylmuramoyl-tripeptide--D-alanyl-D-alanine ligase
MKWTLEEIAGWTNGKIVSDKNKMFSFVGTDTRQNLSEQVFIALKGDSFDAHDYLKQAVEKGAAALIVHRLPEDLAWFKDKTSIVLVEDTLKALQAFANGYRKKINTKIIGITGSNGKTTTKEFTAQILSQFKKTHYNQGSFNNHWGVPLTLLGIPQEAEFAVIEMGMNHAGEITELVKIADPDIVVCTMVGTAHIEFFGTQKKIAEAKSEIYLESRPDTIRIFNQDQELTFDMMYPVAKKFPDSRMLSFSEKNNEADVYFKIEDLTMRSINISGVIAGVKGRAEVNIFGKQNLTNLMAAANIAYACKMQPEQIWSALTECKTSWGRNQFIQTQKGAEVLFDGYNANPDSMRALLENVTLLKVNGKKIGIFGQMKEQGEVSPLVHKELGLLAGKSGLAEIYFIGENFKNFSEGIAQSGFNGRTYIESDFSDNMGKALESSLSAGDIVIIKGSRGAKTERFIPFCQPINWQAKS